MKDLFSNEEHQQQVHELLNRLLTTPLNVGAQQFARALLILSKGNIEHLASQLNYYLKTDPRDAIMAAENLMGNPGHYFNRPFGEV